MPFPGSTVIAPVMASRQGMMNLAFHQVSDQASPVVQTFAGALTGKGSGLLTPVTQSASGVAQSQMQQAAQAPGRAMLIGGSEFWAAGSSTGVMQGAGAPGNGAASAMSTAAGMLGGPGAGAPGMAAAQSMMGSAAGSLGSAAAAAGSSLGAASGAAGGTAGSAAASAAASALGGSGMSSQGSIMPGQRPAPPQFTALPTIPSVPRLQDVASRLGAMAGPAAPLVSRLMGGGAADDAVVKPVSQFAGSVANTSAEAARGL